MSGTEALPLRNASSQPGGSPRRLLQPSDTTKEANQKRHKRKELSKTAHDVKKKFAFEHRMSREKGGGKGKENRVQAEEDEAG